MATYDSDYEGSGLELVHISDVLDILGEGYILFVNLYFFIYFSKA